MIKRGVTELKEKLNTERDLKIAIIDNNLMGFLVNLRQETDILPWFDIYDIILIPKWVEEEINDGQTRIDCLNHIATRKGVYVIDEKEYEELSGYKDVELMLLFQASTFLMGDINGKIKKYLNQSEEVTYEQAEDGITEYNKFIEELNNNILKNKEDNPEPGKRIKRKNAGEISICVLSYLLGYYYDGIENITIFTFDKDCYDYIKRAKEILYDKDDISKSPNRFKNRECKAITFKSSDLIYNELYDLNKEECIEIITKIRKNPRNIKYTQKKSDGSIEENRKLMGTDEFIEFIKDKDKHLIF